MNFESLPINFCNKKTLNIKSDDYKEYLLDFIRSTYRIDISKRNLKKLTPFFLQFPARESIKSQAFAPFQL